jgi:dihydrofolate synthase/folylpolyglutamate synthase
MLRAPSPEAAAFTMADAVAALSSALRFGINPSLDGIRALAAALGEPQDMFTVVQVTGTNGKTSVARMTAAILAAHGFRTGVYTSPHLVSYAERVEVFGVDTDDAFARAIGVAVTTARDIGLELTEFELLTGAALWMFADLGVEIAVLEVGLGGRWDATSVADPAVAVVSGVGLDHTDRLGETVDEIAADKAHIIKAASVAVLGPGVTDDVAPIFLERAASVGSYSWAVREKSEASPVGDDLTVRFDVTDRPTTPTAETVLDVRAIHGSYAGLCLHAPAYQAPNAATAVAAAEAAIGRGLELAATRRALDQLTVAGRFQVVARDPIVVLDGAHNPQAAGVLADAIADAWPSPGRRPVIVLGMLRGKDAAGFIEALAPVAAAFFVAAPDADRAQPADALAAQVEAVTGARSRVFVSVGEALAAARAATEDGVVVTGSLYSVGEALRLSRQVDIPPSSAGRTPTGV